MLADSNPSWCGSTSARADVETSRPKSISSRVGPGPDRCRVEWAQADDGLSELRPMLGRAGLGRCRVEQARVDVGSSRLGPMSGQAGLGRAGLGRCRDEQANVDVGKNGPEPMSRLISSRTGPGRCLDWYRAKSAWAHIWTNFFGSMSGWVGPGRCRVEQA